MHLLPPAAFVPIMFSSALCAASPADNASAQHILSPRPSESSPALICVISSGNVSHRQLHAEALLIACLQLRLSTRMLQEVRVVDIEALGKLMDKLEQVW